MNQKLKEIYQRLLVLGLTGFLLFLVGCGSDPATSSDQVDTKTTQVPVEISPGVSDDEILFGMHTDLSGPAAIFGVESVNGIRMRFDEQNEMGGVHGRKLRIIAEDSQYQVQESLRIVNKLIYRDEIFAMLLALGTPNNVAVMDDQFEAGVPNLFPLTGSIKMAEPHHELMFTLRGIYYYEIRAAVRYFVEEKGRTAPCVAYMDNEYGKEIYDAAVDQTNEMGIELVAWTSHEQTETEFTASVLRLREAGCDLVLLGTIINDTIAILDAARELGWTDVDWVGNNAAGGSGIAEHESGSSEGYYVFAHMTRIYPDTEENPEAVEWFNRYKEIFGVRPDVAAMEAYRGANIAIMALEAAGEHLTREKFVSAIANLGTYNDLFGHELIFTKDNHNGLKDTVLAQVQNGRWVKLDETITFNQ